MKRALMALAVTVACAGTAPAVATELITNGDFEGGTLAGWTVNNTGGGGNDFYVIPNGGAGPVSGHPTDVLATGGDFVAVSDQIDAGGEELRQEFVVAPGTRRLTLNFDWFNNTHFPFVGATGAIDGSVAGAEQHGRVDILAAGAPALDVGAGVLLSLLFDAGTLTPFGTTIPWVHETFDLSDLAPGAYELRFGNGQCCNAQEMGVDNVSIERIPEPATLALLGVGLAGLGFSRRKR